MKYFIVKQVGDLVNLIPFQSYNSEEAAQYVCAAVNKVEEKERVKWLVATGKFYNATM